MSPLFSPLHFTSPRFLCLLSFSFLLLSVFFLVSLCCGRCASQAVSNVSQAHHIFMCSCLFLSSALPFSIFSVSLSPCACSLPLYSFSSSLPPAPIFSSVREREGVREGKKEKERKSEWNNGERRGKFFALRNFFFLQNRENITGKTICEKKISSFLRLFLLFLSLSSFSQGVAGLLR